MLAYSLLPDPCDREGHTQPPADLGERHHVRQPDHFRDPPADAVVQDIDREREVDIDEGVLLSELQIVRVPGCAQNLPDCRRMLFQFIVCLDLLRDLLIPTKRLVPRAIAATISPIFISIVLISFSFLFARVGFPMISLHDFRICPALIEKKPAAC